MGKRQITDLFFYRWRYVLSYIVLVVGLGALLYVAGLFAPGGISQEEMDFAVESHQLELGVLYGQQVEQLIHLPYRALQLASTSLLGFSPLALKLPSLVLAGLSAIGFYGLLRLWFKRNVAVISTVILITSSLYLLLSQHATPAISYLFWGVGLLFTTSMLTQAARFRPAWLIAASIIAALSLYTPYHLYIIAALVATSLVHPHARFIVFRQPVWAVATSGTLFVLLAVPLVLGLVAHPSLIAPLLGVPDIGTISLAAVWQNLYQYVNFAKPQAGAGMTPVYGLGITVLLLVGIFRLLSAKYTAKSYIITLWLLFVIPLISLHPQSAPFTLLPVMLLVAFAIDYLIRSWYDLFPRNPYARVAGLLPLAVLVGGLAISGVDRFISGHHYSTAAASTYRNDLRLISQTTTKFDDKPIILLVSPAQHDFYALFADSKTNLQLTVSSGEAIPALSQAPVVIATRDRAGELPVTPTLIITSPIRDSGNRLYVYENRQQ